LEVLGLWAAAKVIRKEGAIPKGGIVEASWHYFEGNETTEVFHCF
jgi:hypothetical protein